MSTLINLLPDLRQAKLRDLRRRQLAVGVGTAVCIACAVLVGIQAIVMAGQKTVIASVSDNITKEKTKLESLNGLIDAMTANEHLTSLPGVYAKRVYLSKFFAAYAVANPVSMTVDSLTVDDQNIFKVTGTAPSFAEVAKLARALEASNVTIGEGAAATNSPYFSNVTVGGVSSNDKNITSFSVTATISSGVLADGSK